MTANTVDGAFVGCGGDSNANECSTYNSEENVWEHFATLIQPRSNHASVQLSEDSFWILGISNCLSTWIFPPKLILNLDFRRVF
jgi:hypothetical protein